MAQQQYGWSDLRALIEGRWKYIRAPRPELYDLAADPGETRNLVAEQPTRAEAFRRALEEQLAAEPAGAGDTELPPEVLEKLGALGYLGGGRGTASEPGADPKDKLEEFRVVHALVREGILELRDQRPQAAAAKFDELLRRSIRGFEVHFYFGEALAALGRCGEAATQFEAALVFQPGFTAAYDSWAECLLKRGQVEPALAVLRQGEQAAPDRPQLYEREGQLLLQLGRRREAIRAWEAAIERAPEAALLRVRLGELYRDEGELERATARLREALALDPEPASYWNALGVVLGAANELGEAVDAFHEALERAPENARYAYNLGLALQRQGKREEAAQAFALALELEPGFGEARARLAELRRGAS